MRCMCVCIVSRTAIALLLVQKAVKPFPLTVSVAVVLFVPLFMAIAGFSCKKRKFIFLLSGCYFIPFYPFYKLMCRQGSDEAMFAVRSCLR